jgi:hypothetical protein
MPLTLMTISEGCDGDSKRWSETRVAGREPMIGRERRKRRRSDLAPIPGPVARVYMGQISRAARSIDLAV